MVMEQQAALKQTSSLAMCTEVPLP